MAALEQGIDPLVLDEDALVMVFGEEFLVVLLARQRRAHPLLELGELLIPDRDEHGGEVRTELPTRLEEGELLPHAPPEEIVRLEDLRPCDILTLLLGDHGDDDDRSILAQGFLPLGEEGFIQVVDDEEIPGRTVQESPCLLPEDVVLL